jgi:aspartyl-tRNA(Asn)/glutamyl-tRNA(Gln) amidotransferase subunit A
MQTIMDAVAALEAGRTSARELVEQALARVADPGGEGARAFVRVDAEPARQMAEAMDALRGAGRAPSRFAGIPVSLKDLVDIAGQPTPAGSRALADAPPATSTAPVVAHLMAAGFVPVGRTNMSEFAFSGLGLNPHYGTPASPWDRATRRIPGGSSSGAAVSVGDGMVFMGLGTDTGGSCRIPAAFCGVVGYKPTAARVPLANILPLSSSLDSVGPLARSVACCALTDAVMAGETPAVPQAAELTGLRFSVPDNVVLDGLDTQVADGFTAALRALSGAGVHLTEQKVPIFDKIMDANRIGGIAPIEAYAWHRRLLAEKADVYDQRIRARIERGAVPSAADYIDLLNLRRTLIAAFDETTRPFDAVIMPTVPILPPPIASVQDSDEAYLRANGIALRNTSLGNFLDRCAISLPLPGYPGTGLMLVGERMGDAKLFAIAAAVEQLLN